MRFLNMRFEKLLKHAKILSQFRAHAFSVQEGFQDSTLIMFAIQISFLVNGQQCSAIETGHKSSRL